mmetsp:Transcript_84796/g.150149  ORF Transcript_84796/g.150149 Transcript_84796/m.150149 type:complete len:356 (+) Transcript_84796:481-1548(+)
MELNWFVVNCEKCVVREWQRQGLLHESGARSAVQLSVGLQVHLWTYETGELREEVREEPGKSNSAKCGTNEALPGFVWRYAQEWRRDEFLTHRHPADVCEAVICNDQTNWNDEPDDTLKNQHCNTTDLEHSKAEHRNRPEHVRYLILQDFLLERQNEDYQNDDVSREGHSTTVFVHIRPDASKQSKPLELALVRMKHCSMKQRPLKCSEKRCFDACPYYRLVLEGPTNLIRIRFLEINLPALGSLKALQPITFLLKMPIMRNTIHHDLVAFPYGDPLDWGLPRPRCLFATALLADGGPLPLQHLQGSELRHLLLIACLVPHINELLEKPNLDKRDQSNEVWMSKPNDYQRRADEN